MLLSQTSPSRINCRQACFPTRAQSPFNLVQTSSEGSNRYGRANTNYPVLETYTEGSILEVKIVVSTTHMVSYSCIRSFALAVITEVLL